MEARAASPTDGKRSLLHRRQASFVRLTSRAPAVIRARSANTVSPLKLPACREVTWLIVKQYTQISIVSHRDPNVVHPVPSG